MRNQFRQYYRPSMEEFAHLWASCLFVLDANVLLNLYRYSDVTRDELLRILGTIADRLWVPHQAALEYQRNRPRVIAQQVRAYRSITDLLERSIRDLENQVRAVVQNGRHPYLDVDRLLGSVRPVFEEIADDIKALEEEHPDLLEDDPIRDAITVLLVDRVGTGYEGERLDDVYKEAKRRCDERIPPGYEDVAKKTPPGAYGDIVLWFQVVDKAMEAKSPIILVTDDRKDDWWWREAGRTLGPRPELVDEIGSKAGVLFWMYPADKFMEYAAEHLEREVKPEAVKEARMLRETDEDAWRAQALVETEVEQYNLDLLLRGPRLSEQERLQPLLDFVRGRYQEALREEDMAARVEAKFARTAPLAPNEDIEPTDAVAMSAAFKRRRETTAMRQAWSSKYRELLLQIDRSAGDTSKT